VGASTGSGPLRYRRTRLRGPAVARGSRGSRGTALVEDDGAGFSSKTPKHWGKWGGMGLFSIREKLHSVGGEIRVFSEKGKGSTVALVAPLMFEGGKTS